MVRLTQDQMAAYVMIPKPDEVCGETCRIAEDLIFLALEEAGVIEGISEEGIEQLCSGGVSFGHEAVSYTHLDVYKRQV